MSWESQRTTTATSTTTTTVTTDLSGTGYGTTMTKPDGSTVEMHLDSSFNAFQPPARG